MGWDRHTSAMRTSEADAVAVSGSPYAKRRAVYSAIKSAREVDSCRRIPPSEFSDSHGAADQESQHEKRIAPAALIVSPRRCRRGTRQRRQAPDGGPR